MSEYMRLTERNQLGVAYPIEGKGLGDLTNRLAELEDKIESGKIVEPPCKVGDTVYAILEIDSVLQIVPYTASKIIIRMDGEFYFDTPTSYSHRLKFGHRVFVDKSEAERHLKELKGE